MAAGWRRSDRNGVRWRPAAPWRPKVSRWMMIDGCDLSAESAIAADWSDLTSSGNPAACVSFSDGVCCLPCGKLRIWSPMRPFELLFSPHAVTAVPFFTVTAGGPRRVNAGLWTRGVRPKSLFFFFVCAASCTSCQMALAPVQPVQGRTSIKVPAGALESDCDVFIMFNCNLFSPSPLDQPKLSRHQRGLLLSLFFSAPLQRTSSVIAPYGEMCLYNNPESALVRRHC